MSDKLAIRTMDDLSRLSAMFAKSGFFKDTGDAAACGVKILAGQELGFTSFASMTGIHMIKGKPTIGATLMAAAVKRSQKYDYRVKEMSDESVTLAFYEDGEHVGDSPFTKADAEKASTQNMSKYPRNMLFARAISNGVKWYCPDLFLGAPVYTPEEMGAEIDEDGEVIDATFAVEAQEALRDALASPTTPDEVVPPPVASQPAPKDTNTISAGQMVRLASALRKAGIGRTPEEKAQGRDFVAWLAGADELSDIKELSHEGAERALQRVGGDVVDEETGEVDYEVDKAKLEAEFQRWADYKASQEFDADNPIDDAAPWEAFA